MFWIILTILAVGYFIVKAIYSNNQGANSTSQQRLLPISKRNSMLAELIQNLQAQLSSDYTKEIEDRTTEMRAKKADEQEWGKDHIKLLKKAFDDFGKLVEINSRLCERFRSDEQHLLEQQTDWGRLLEHYRDIKVESNLNKALIDSHLDPKYDEVSDRQRGGEMHELYKRIMSRAKSADILTKELRLSQHGAN